MTSHSLLFWIALGILVQLTAHLGMVFWRHWRAYKTLHMQKQGFNLNLGQDKSSWTEGITQDTRLGFQTFRVDCKVVENANQSICSFYLVPENGQPLAPFLPGQYLTFSIDLPTITGGTEQIIRCYSLSDAPRPNCYRISIKRLYAPTGSETLLPGRASNYFHDQVSVGSLLKVRLPSGHFHIDQSDAPVVLIGAGIGITPMLSMLIWILSNQPGREVWLFYGVRNGLEVIMKAHLEGLAILHQNFHLRVCFSAPRPEDVYESDYHHQGWVNINLLQAQLPPKSYHYFICGPTPMMENLVPALEDWGVKDNFIHFEAFGPASIKRRSSIEDKPNKVGAVDIVVTFTESGKLVKWLPFASNLLEFAEANGVTLNSGCRAGSCGSCQTKLRSGEVTYQYPPDFDPEYGTCLPCVCVPKSSLILEA